MEIIKSRDNKFIKTSRKLKIKKFRQQDGLFLIEGIRFVEEALKAEASIEYCLYSKNLDTSSDRAKALLKDISHKEIDSYPVEEELLEDICDTQSPQGIVAVVKRKEYSMDDIIRNSQFLVAVDRIQDPGNLGTIIRTADAAGVDGVVISEGTVDPYSSKVLRSTMGSIFHLPVVSCPSMPDALRKAREEKFVVYGSSLAGKNAYFEESYSGKTIIIIGNEANGIDDSIASLADKLIKIPMPGNAESLNAAVAAAIMIFEVVKHRTYIDK